MEEQPPKKVIRRAAVPTVAKEKLAPIDIDDSKGTIGLNLLLLILLAVVGSFIYCIIFKKETLEAYFPIIVSKQKTEVVQTDTQQSTEKEENSADEFSTIIGEDGSSPDPSTTEEGNSKVYPAGSTFYLISGTFVFYPYAEKYKAKMSADGYSAKILTTGTDRKYYRIYLEKSTNINAMRAKRDKLRASTGLNLWIFAQ